MSFLHSHKRALGEYCLECRKEDLEAMREIRSNIEKRATGLGVDDFWFNGKLWSQMSEKEKEETRRLLTE